MTTTDTPKKLQVMNTSKRDQFHREIWLMIRDGKKVRIGERTVYNRLRAGTVEEIPYR